MGILLDTLYLYGFIAAPGQFSESVQTDTDSLPAVHAGRGAAGRDRLRTVTGAVLGTHHNPQ